MKNDFCRVNFIYRIIKNDISSNICKYVRTRFPPEPNGYLHIGHVKSICLNFDIAKNFAGECYVRLDDTNPTKSSEKYVNSIKNDINWLGFDFKKNIRYTSDYFEKIYDYAIELIKKKLAYVDETSLDELSFYKGTLKKPGRNSPFRNRSVSTNLTLFEKMKNGYFSEGTACLRAKIDMSSSVISMRDPILYRIKYKKHYKLGNKWCIYPTYDFSHCISDFLEGITHSLCTLEFQNNRNLYDWILSKLCVNNAPRQYEFSRLNISYNFLSKRKLYDLIKKNIITGWDDPRVLTISGLRRRGYTPTSICNFCRDIGISKQDSNIDIKVLESYIRKELDRSACRIMVVLNPIKLIIENMSYDDIDILYAPNHPKNLNMGRRKIYFTKEIYIDRSDFLENPKKGYKKLFLGGSVKLKYAYVIKANSLKKDCYGNIKHIYCTMYKEYNDIVNGIIHWISNSFYVSVEIRLYDYLFNVSNPNKYKDYLKFINKNSLIICNGVAEERLLNSKPGETFQFEREGYFCADIKDHCERKLVFNRITSLKKNRFL